MLQLGSKHKIISAAKSRISDYSARFCLTTAALLTLWAMSLVMLTSCKHTVKTTTVEIVDSVRHYYPVIMGQVLKVKMEVHNTGTEPLIIDDIQPSWGSFVDDENNDDTGEEGSVYGIIPAGKKATFYLDYRTKMNSGEVSHTVRLYGNISPKGVKELNFDVNIVPPASADIDYEENNNRAREHTETIRGLIDGKQQERGYYVGDKYVY